MKRSLEVCNLEVAKKIYLEKKTKKEEQEREKYFIDLPLQYAVIVRILRSTCKKIIYPTSQTLYRSYRPQTSWMYLAQIFVLHCQLALLSRAIRNWSLEHFINKKNVKNLKV